MSVVLMSKRELNRLDVLARLDRDRLTVLAAAGLMNVTPRQTYRLLRGYRDGGAAAIAQGARPAFEQSLAGVVGIMPWRSFGSGTPILGPPWPPRSWPNGTG